jgi:hypothetical protein
MRAEGIKSAGGIKVLSVIMVSSESAIMMWEAIQNGNGLYCETDS